MFNLSQILSTAKQFTDPLFNRAPQVPQTNDNSSFDINHVLNKMQPFIQLLNKSKQINNSSEPYQPVKSEADIQITKDAVFKAFPFTTAAHQTIDEAKIGILKPVSNNPLLKESVGAEGQMQPKGSDFTNFIVKHVTPFSPKAADFIINHTQFLQNLDKANIDISNTDPTVLAHEMLHQVFDSSVMTSNNLSPNYGKNAEGFGNRFLDTWDKVAKVNQNAPLAQIDARINQDYNTKDMTEADLATERFAYLGELVGKYGLSVIPKELRAYYVGIFESKSTLPKPDELNKSANSIQQNYPQLPADMLQHVLFKESSTGKNAANKSGDVGKYGWLTGFTKIANDQLIKIGKKPNLDTVEGTLTASADYLNYISNLKKTTDRDKLYNYYRFGPHYK